MKRKGKGQTSKLIFEMDDDSNLFCQLDLRDGAQHAELLSFAEMIYRLCKGTYFHVIRKAVSLDDHEGIKVLLPILDTMMEFTGNPNGPAIRPSEVFPKRD